MNSLVHVTNLCPAGTSRPAFGFVILFISTLAQLAVSAIAKPFTYSHSTTKRRTKILLHVLLLIRTSSPSAEDALK